MRRADRLFEIIQLLRAAFNPMTAARVAEALEVSSRTIYRDIAALQSMRVPIEGSAGVGYVMRRGYDLPPLMFTVEEIEAIAVGLNLIHRTGDRALLTSAGRVVEKIALVLPAEKRRTLEDAGLYASGWGATPPHNVDLDEVRHAIRQERKLKLMYRDQENTPTQRIVQPIALIYYLEVIILAAWCELRQDFRHFRVDRIVEYAVLEETFSGRGAEMRAVWLADRSF